MSGSDSGACFSPSLSCSVCITQAANTDTYRNKKACTLALFVPILATNTNTKPCQTQPLNHTQPSAFDSVGIRGALGLLLQSSTVLLLLLFLLVASLSPALVLSFAERRRQAASRLVSSSSGCNVMPLFCGLWWCRNQRCVLSIGSLSAVCGVSCWIIMAGKSRRGRRDSRDENESFNYHSYWLPTLHLIC